MNDRFIVAEVSKNWARNEERDGSFISRHFEHVIDVNLRRGYRLHSWSLATAYHDNCSALTETIIAVFERIST